MTPFPSVQQANLDLVMRVGTLIHTGFHNEPHSLYPYGDEFVVWRIVDGRISETWDIPAINTVRPHRSATDLPGAV